MKVALKHAGKWLHFQCPEKILRTNRIEEVLPMLREAEDSGLFAAGFVSYEAAPAFDSALTTHPPGGFPLLCLGLFNAPDVLDGIEAPPSASFVVGELKPSVSKSDFISTIGEIKERIAEGATYQVNYTYRLNASFSGDARAFFHALVKGQKTDYAAFVDTGDFTICSASPELFFSLKEGRILARPMKGTARRGRTFSEDWKAAEALRESGKDRAENIMIVDMIRNDIGRIAEPGSVEAASLFDIEKYPTVWQMTSSVRGKLEPQNMEGEAPSEPEQNNLMAAKDHKKLKEEDVPESLRSFAANSPCLFSDVFRALFPCASITGAPKAKTMEIIQGLEHTSCGFKSPRKIYTGSIGFMAPQGEACFNVAIRTALIDRGKGTLEFGVGGGIVWDSNAEAEYEETLTKARVLTQPRPEFQLLETLLWEPGTGIFLLDGHLQRLGKSAAYFDVPLDQYAVLQALEDYHTCLCVIMRLRLLVSRNGAFEVQAIPWKSGRGAASRIVLAKEPVDSQDVFLFHKTTHRVVHERAKADFPEADEVILWNERGEVTEGCIANVVIRKDGRLITPPVECGLLAGTFREHLLKAGEIVEQKILVDDLKAADEIFLINSVRRWRRAEWLVPGDFDG